MEAVHGDGSESETHLLEKWSASRLSHNRGKSHKHTVTLNNTEVDDELAVDDAALGHLLVLHNADTPILRRTPLSPLVMSPPPHRRQLLQMSAQTVAQQGADAGLGVQPHEILHALHGFGGLLGQPRGRPGERDAERRPASNDATHHHTSAAPTAPPPRNNNRHPSERRMSRTTRRCRFTSWPQS